MFTIMLFTQSLLIYFVSYDDKVDIDKDWNWWDDVKINKVMFLLVIHGIID